MRRQLKLACYRHQLTYNHIFLTHNVPTIAAIAYMYHGRCTSYIDTANWDISSASLRLKNTQTANTLYYDYDYYYYYYKCHGLQCCHHTVAGEIKKTHACVWSIIC